MKLMRRRLTEIINWFRKKRFHKNKINVKIDPFDYNESLQRNKEYFSNSKISVANLRELEIELSLRINKLNCEIEEELDEHGFKFGYYSFFLSGFLGYLISGYMSTQFDNLLDPFAEFILRSFYGIGFGVLLLLIAMPFFIFRLKTVVRVKKLRDEVQELTVKQKIVTLETDYRPDKTEYDEQ